MKYLVRLLPLLAIASLSSCTLAGRVIQTPIRLFQAGVRTVTDVDETQPAASADAARSHGIALKASSK